MTLLAELLWFLPWCWFVNTSFTLVWTWTRDVPAFSFLALPLDGGASMSDGHRVLGDSTTVLGLVVAISFGVVGALFFPGHRFFLLALLTLLGHAAGSFVKRRLGLPRGAFLPFVDHGDYVIVAGVTLVTIGGLSFVAFLVSYIVVLVTTPFFTYLAYRLGIRAVRL